MLSSLAFAILVLGCSQADPPALDAEHGTAPAPTAAPAPSDVAPAGDRKLLFFLNPNGRPCQMQIAILDQLGDQLGVEVQRVSVLEEASRPTLYQYGIRSLPALILVNGSGGELHRFTPGIQPAEAILAALD
jgi:thioredoxin 1